MCCTLDIVEDVFSSLVFTSSTSCWRSLSITCSPNVFALLNSLPYIPIVAVLFAFNIFVSSLTESFSVASDGLPTDDRCSDDGIMLSDVCVEDLVLDDTCSSRILSSSSMARRSSPDALFIG
uniref:Uncharacterized protein n=1 Tax=Parascaris equorum TaxID=6256 RepID=A0A914RV79_PAREQ